MVFVRDLHSLISQSAGIRPPYQRNRHHEELKAYIAQFKGVSVDYDSLTITSAEV